jgi:hypothetical protein
MQKNGKGCKCTQKFLEHTRKMRDILFILDDV